MAFLLINPSGFQDWPPCPAGTDGRLVTGNPLEDWRRCSGWTERTPGSKLLPGNHLGQILMRTTDETRTAKTQRRTEPEQLRRAIRSYPTIRNLPIRESSSLATSRERHKVRGRFRHKSKRTTMPVSSSA